ncbi:MAG TPA: hypothetical protein ENJ35_09170 [Gammaproteobacteria bacterium]|nr:hypothetical protein [Gammaproteobacteria bacterium]
MKPDTRAAMSNLIDEIAKAMPFGASNEDLCAPSCSGCSIKLLEHIDMELSDWKRRLDEGDIPTFGDLQQLAKTAKKVYAVLDRNGVV